ncbi:uncharacterized protein An03g04020 [Aspergillus niger]|uniref:Contig An03c0120, genomic contig n=2 Tax=Aspergillus niger TaxID=5061 RepID=A2QGP4_ASPNC|nr:uncharacterized protein An03g04020 [Aspergillus niger]CAK47841.1 unnamed protein product [Aspergillus niger]
MASVHFGHRTVRSKQAKRDIHDQQLPPCIQLPGWTGGPHCATREWVSGAQPGSPEQDRFGTNEQLQMVLRPRESLEDPSGPDWLGVAPNTWRTPHGESSRIWANVARRVRSSYSTRNTPIGEGSIGSALRKVDVAVQATMSTVPWFRRVFRQIPATLNDELYTLRLDPAYKVVCSCRANGSPFTTGYLAYSSDVVQHSAVQRINLPMRRLGPVGRYASTKMIYETSTVSIHLLQRNGDGEDGDSQNFDLFRSPAEEESCKQDFPNRMIYCELVETLAESAQAVGVARILSHQPGPWYAPALGWVRVPGSD